MFFLIISTLIEYFSNYAQTYEFFLLFFFSSFFLYSPFLIYTLFDFLSFLKRISEKEKEKLVAY